MRKICHPFGALALCACLSGCTAFANRGLLESPADAKISADVRSRLGKDPALGAPNLISVQTVGGVVYMRGLLSTPYQIQEAGSVAARAPGVVRVENMLSLDNAR